MEDDNLHRDIDRRAPAIECNAESIVCELLVDSFGDVRRLLARSHRPDRIRDAPFCGEGESFFAWKTQIVILRRERERMEISYEAIK